MTETQQILSTLQRLEKKVDRLERDRHQPKEYITAEEVKKRYGASKSTLQRLRKNGTLEDYKFTKTHRNFRYAVPELEKVFALKLKVA